HRLVISDGSSGRPRLPEPAEVTYQEVADQVGGARVWDWEKTQELGPGRYTTWDHSFQRVGDPLEGTRGLAGEVALADPQVVAPVRHRLGSPAPAADSDLAEVFDYPGGYAWHFDAVSKDRQPQPADLDWLTPAKDRTAAVRMEEDAARRLTV